jgi:hypothetical protein
LRSATVVSSPVLFAAAAGDDASDALGFGCQPGGGTTWTMLSHFGHVRIAPIADSLRTASRRWHVGHSIENRCSSTVPGLPRTGIAAWVAGAVIQRASFGEQAPRRRAMTILERRRSRLPAFSADRPNRTRKNPSGRCTSPRQEGRHAVHPFRTRGPANTIRRSLVRFPGIGPGLLPRSGHADRHRTLRWWSGHRIG